MNEVLQEAGSTCRDVVDDIVGFGKLQVTPRNRLKGIRSGTAMALWVREVGPKGIGGDL
jgi:hypothetical protein